MGFGDFWDQINELKEEFVEMCRDARNDFSVLVQESKEELRQAAEDDAYNLNYNLGEAVHKLNEAAEKRDKITETMRNITHAGEHDCVLCDGDYELADHLLVGGVFGIWTHHGIYIGNGNVIHYNLDSYGDISVHEVSVDEFANGRTIYKFTTDVSPLRYSPSEAVRRAKSQLGKEEYNLIYNNCENFVRWCRFGKKITEQNKKSRLYHRYDETSGFSICNQHVFRLCGLHNEAILLYASRKANQQPLRC